MTDESKSYRKHLGTAKEHLAGIKAAAVWRQDLAAVGLLKTQTPIRELPLPDTETQP
jgi:hypothetical protein